jgi:glycosyltransferase involved in cell wall biosynthesis
MRVLIAHNAYQHRGGEDSVVAEEAALLRAHGHEVELLAAHNDEIAGLGRVELLRRTLWSRPAADEMRARCAAFRPDVVHVHNSFPLLSPAIHWAAAEAGVPVVQTLHNFRLLCPQAMLLREGRVCEDCVGRLPWRGALHGCYRGSVAQSTVLAGMLTLHRGLGTWQRRVNRFIALNDFCRAKFVEGGLPAERIAVKPNFVDLPAPAEGPREGLLFVGRLSPEKGLDVLAAAARESQLPVTVLGSGPMQPALADEPLLNLRGALPMEQVLEQMRSAAALVMPSVWYENFPRTLVEAWACGLPVIASRLGAMAELVEEGVTGLLFEAGNAKALAQTMRWAREHPDDLAAMGRRAREHYAANYTAQRNLQQLMTIYDEAVAEGPRHD